jgi:hypothetical protein
VYKYAQVDLKKYEPTLDGVVDYDNGKFDED